ncbi:PIG-X [Xylariaceae sp. FL0804]|nr:PIG-X [Xylariaceae sp. FL0804]
MHYFLHTSSTMRQRVTFFHRNENGIDPEDLKVGDSLVAGPDLKAVREQRATLALEELPADLQQLLRESHELHIRWNSLSGHENLGPWNSRLPPGLHVFYTPQKPELADSRELCAFLQTAFGERIDCLTPSETFTRLPNDRFSHSTAYQYFQPLDSLAPLVDYLERHACTSASAGCREWGRELDRAASLDVSYDAISHAVKVTTIWPEANQSLSVSSHPGHRTEVGILTPDTPPHIEPHEQGVTGLLTVLGEDQKPSPVLFSFPSRHQDAGSTFTSAFLEPTGLHPTLQLRLDQSMPPMENAHCSPHVYLTLPRTIFADKYQLSDELFLSSKNLRALRYMSQPVDLEAPAYAVNVWGSTVLLELQPPSEQTHEPWTAEIPLHLRYMSPAEGGYATATVTYPAVFWACTVEEGTKFSNSPFDRVNLGYDGLFGPRTLFWHVNPSQAPGGQLTHAVQVPVLDLEKSGWISAGTTAAILVGFAFVVFKLLSVYVRTGYGSQESGREAVRKKEQ